LLLGSLIGVMVLSWSLNFVFGKTGLAYLPPLTLASFRVVLASLLMVPIYAVYLWRASRRGAGERPGSRVRFSGRDWKTFVQLGLLGVAGNQMFFTVGLSYTTVGHSALIIGTGPISILFLAWALGLEALTVKKLLGMGLAFGGVAVLAAEKGLSLQSATLRGDLITLAGSLAFALYTVLGKRAAAVYDSVAMNAFNYFAGGLVVLPVAIWQGMRLSRAVGWRAVAWQGWAAVAYMAVFASVVAYLIYFWVLKYMSASRLGAFSYLHPLFTTGLGIGLLGERVTHSLLAGGALVVAGVYLIEWGPRENQQEDNTA
jgi:drug/metabolite transporter (DMT)-like permease